MNKPIRVSFKIKKGKRTLDGSYGLLHRMRESGRLLLAWSNSTGRVIARG